MSVSSCMSRIHFHWCPQQTHGFQWALPLQTSGKQGPPFLSAPPACCLSPRQLKDMSKELLEVPLGAQAGFWLHEPWWAATSSFSSNMLSVLSMTTAEGRTKITQSLHQDGIISCKIYWLSHWELPLLSQNRYMSFCEKGLTPGTNAHGKIHHGSRKKCHLLALLAEISNGFMKTWSKTKDLLRLTLSQKLSHTLWSCHWEKDFFRDFHTREHMQSFFLIWRLTWYFSTHSLCLHWWEGWPSCEGWQACRCPSLQHWYQHGACTMPLGPARTWGLGPWVTALQPTHI